MYPFNTPQIENGAKDDDHPCYEIGLVKENEASLVMEISIPKPNFLIWSLIGKISMFFLGPKALLSPAYALHMLLLKKKG
jgi:hypothetical protein